MLGNIASTIIISQSVRVYSRIYMSKQALQYWISFVPWKIYGKDSEYNNSLRIAYAQIDKTKITEDVSRFNKLVKDII